MTGNKVRALCESIRDAVDDALVALPWRDNPDVHESLCNAKELLDLLQSGFPEDDREELNFED